MVQCNKPGVGPQANHSEHTGLSERDFIDWPNPDYVPTKRSAATKVNNKGKLKAMASRITEEPKTLRHYIPTTADARGRVALHLIENAGKWVWLDDINIPDVGGSAAPRKVEELINYGWEIEVKDEKYKLKVVPPQRPLWDSEYAKEVKVQVNG